MTLSAGLTAQQLENPGFEDWEGSGNKAEPVNWSSLKTATPSTLANFAPTVLSEAGNAHSGSKCVELENKKVFGTVATGILTNVLVHANADVTKSYVATDVADDKWNTPLKYKPDSLVGWYKYDPAGTDYGSALAVIHKGTAKAPDAAKTNYIATANFDIPSKKADTWTRFSVPFDYLTSETPEYIILVLSSGNGTNGVEKSIAHFDDLELIYNNPVQVEEINAIEKISIYSSREKIHFDLRNYEASKEVELSVYNLMGKEQANLKTQEMDLVELDNITPGIYVCVVKANNQYFRKKIIVQ